MEEWESHLLSPVTLTTTRKGQNLSNDINDAQYLIDLFKYYSKIGLTNAL